MKYYQSIYQVWCKGRTVEIIIWSTCRQRLKPVFLIRNRFTIFNKYSHQRFKFPNKSLSWAFLVWPSALLKYIMPPHSIAKNLTNFLNLPLFSSFHFTWNESGAFWIYLRTLRAIWGFCLSNRPRLLKTDGDGSLLISCLKTITCVYSQHGFTYWIFVKLCQDKWHYLCNVNMGVHDFSSLDAVGRDQVQVQEHRMAFSSPGNYHDRTPQNPPPKN